MKSKVYLLFAVIGFIVPNVLVCMESIESGNILLYTNPAATIADMFANRIASIFILDLLLVLFAFFCWTIFEGKRYQMKGLGWIWLVTMLFGLGGSFPLFLYLRERKIN